MSNPKFSRRDFLRTSAMATGALALAACTPTAAPDTGDGGGGGASAEGSTVSYWYAWGNLDPAMAAFIETDEWKEHMGDVTLEYKGSVAGEAILTAIAGGTPPDAGSNFDYPNLYTRGAVVTVQDMAEASDIVTQDRMLDWTWDFAWFGGDMIGVPGIESYVQWGLNYNADAASQAGLDADAPPKTWSEVMAWHEELTQKDDAGNLLQVGLDPHDAMGGDVDFQAASYGIKWYDEETKQFNLDNERMAELMDTTAEFIRVADPDQFAGMRQTEGNGGWGAAFESGVQTMIIEGYWHPGEAQINKPEIAQHNRASWAPVPDDRADVNLQAVNAHLLQIFKGGNNVEGAFKLGEFFNTVTACEIIFKEVGWIHPINDFLPMIDGDAFPGLQFYIDSQEAANEWYLLRRCPIHWFVKGQWDSLRDQVARDEITATEAAETLNRIALEEFDAQGLAG